MNRLKAIRLGLGLAITVVAVVAAFAPSAFAVISTDASTVYGSTVPGAHTDYTIIQEFEYGNGAEPTASTGAGQDLKKWIVDSPAGLIGNPNAIPYEDRCDPTSFDPTPAPAAAYNTFFTGSCPASSQVGEARIYLVNDADSGTCPNTPLTCLLAGQDMAALSGPMLGKIYILKTDPEVPVTLGTLLTSASYQNFDFSAYGGNVCTTAPGTPCAIQPKTKSILAPVTNRSDTYNGDDGDFRLRTIPAEYSNPPSALLPTVYGHPALGSGGTPLHIRRIDQQLYGMADPNDNFVTAGQGDTPFLTMPARCDSWDSYSYAFAWNGGGGSLAMDPNHPGDNTYVQSTADSVTPDCSTKPQLQATVTSTLSNPVRGDKPALTVTVADPNPLGNDQMKTLVTTLPASVSINVAALNNLCTTAQRDSNSCPAASQVGTATVATPLIGAGLTGKVYAVEGATQGLPYLSIEVDGAIKFRLDGKTKFVGASANMIETTIDNLPQAPFTNFTVNINGGSDSSLLLNRKCPTDGSVPEDGPITYTAAGYVGNAGAGSSPTTMNPCYGITRPANRRNCTRVGKKLRVTPQNLIATANVAKVELLMGKRSGPLARFATRTGGTFRLGATVRSKVFKTNTRNRIELRVVYKDGHVVRSGTATFRTCGRR